MGEGEKKGAGGVEYADHLARPRPPARRLLGSASPLAKRLRTPGEDLASPGRALDQEVTRRG
jgi:hypothetical protein